jgi:hypothetical protein
MQNITVNPKKTLAHYIFNIEATQKTTHLNAKPDNNLYRISVRDWWTSLPENQDIPVYIHIGMYSDFYAKIKHETEKAILLAIPTPTCILEKWIPKTAIHTMQTKEEV